VLGGKRGHRRKRRAVIWEKVKALITKGEYWAMQTGLRGSRRTVNLSLQGESRTGANEIVVQLWKNSRMRLEEKLIRICALEEKTIHDMGKSNKRGANRQRMCSDELECNLSSACTQGKQSGRSHTQERRVRGQEAIFLNAKG